MSIATLRLACSTSQALDVWTDLVRALMGTNGYGGNTAEVYGYRLRTESPARPMGLTFMSEEEHGDDERARADMADLCAAFEYEFAVRIEIDGLSLSDWREAGDISHRCHPRVLP